MYCLQIKYFHQYWRGQSGCFGLRAADLETIISQRIFRPSNLSSQTDPVLTLTLTLPQRLGIRAMLIQLGFKAAHD